jgi:tellurite methyltransferase
LKDSAHLWAAAKEHQLAVENSSISKMFWKPSPCLEKVIEIIETMRYEMGLLRQGLAIDLACGSGRDLVFLALRGWTAVGFDYLESARKRALELANQCGTSIEIHCIDIERCYNEILTRYCRKADVVNISRYLNRNLIGFFKELVKPGGFIVFHTFMEGCSKPRKKKYLLAKGELAQLFSDFKILEDKVITLLDGRLASFFLGQKPNV